MKARTSIFRRLYGKTLQELATEYGVSPSTVWHLHHRGLMPNQSTQEDTVARRKLCTRLNKFLTNIDYRCSNPKDKKYAYYGGKGIRNLLSLHDLERLWKRDEAEKLSHPSIDRIDPQGHYTFINCRFIEHQENRLQGGRRTTSQKRAPVVATDSRRARG